MELKYDELLGHDWVETERDCFSLTRDFFKLNFDIDMPNFIRPKNWNADNLDLIKNLYKKAGFEIVTDTWDDLRPADILCMAIHSTNCNHLAVYVGDNNIIHHLFGTKSREELLRPFWRMVTMYILRHPDVPDLRPTFPDTNIEDILRARFRL